MTISDPEWQWVLERLVRRGECWEWRGMKSQGYGRARFQRGDRKQSFAVHRLVFERLVGPIPDGFEIDHLCKNTACSEPRHLDAVPPQVNNMRSDSLAARRNRQELCAAGHPLSGANLYVHPKRGTRDCRECRRLRTKAFFAANPTYKREYRARQR